MQISRLKSLNLASRFTFLAMQSSHIKSLATLAILCLLPNFGLKAQTSPTIVNTAETAARALAADAALTVTSDGSIALTTGVAVTGAGNNTIINSGTISSDDDYAIDITADGFTLTNNAGATIEGNEDAIRTQGDVAIVNAGTITAATNGTYRAIYLQGTADATTLAAQATAPVYDATGTDLAGKWSGYDAYYFNAKITNEATGIIEVTGLTTAIDAKTDRVQIINHGTIEVTDSGNRRFNGGGAIAFTAGADQGFVYNTGTIRSFNGNAISAAIGLLNGVHTPANDAAEIVIHNDGGTIESTGGAAISISRLNLIVNSGTIDGTTAIAARGVPSASMLAAQATRPAYNATGTDLAGKWSGYDAYYFNAKILNEATGIIRSNAAAGSRAIDLSEKRTQIINHGAITGRAPSRGASGAVSTILFDASNGALLGLQEASQNFLYNTGTISSLGPDATIRASYATPRNFAAAEANEITIHNTGTIEAAASTAIFLQSLNLVVNSGAITGGTNGNGIRFAGTANANTIANPDRPAYDSTQALRDAYYFNNKVINEVVGSDTGTITGKGTNHGIRIDGARAQVLNTGGTITAEASGQGIVFHTGSGQGFVQNSGSITSASGNAIHAVSGIDEITIHNTGTIESTSSHAIVLRSLNLVVNSNAITGGTDSHGIHLAGAPSEITIALNPTAPAWDAPEADRDAYYFNNTIINEVGGTITGKGTDGHGIHIVNKRAQIFNYGDIDAEGTGHGIYFAAGSGESIVVNTGNIRSVNGWGIYADDATDGAIVVINGGCIEGGLGAIRLSGANDILVIRSGSKITGNVDFDDGSDELIYAGAEASGRLADSVLLNLETTSEPDSDSDIGLPPPDSSGGGPSGGSGGSLGNYQSLFALSDELILDLNAGIQDAIYEHNFSLNSEKSPRRNSSRRAPRKASEKPSWWTQAFGSFRAQDESDDNAKASHILGGVLVGYDLTPEQVGNLGLKDLGLPLEIKNLGFFLGVALGSLSTDDDAELITQNFFGGINFELAKDKFFYGFNFTLGITYYNSERSIEESGETVNIEGRYTGFFLSPEFIIGMKTEVKVPSTTPKKDELSFWERMKAQVNGMEIVPSLRVRYSLALLGEYDEAGDAANRISAEKRNTGTIESRAQVAFPLQLANQAWKLEPRLGLEYRIDLNKSDFDVETLATETPIDYDAEKENTLGIFGGLSVQYLKENTAFKFNVDTIYGSESLVLRAQAGFGFQF